MTARWQDIETGAGLLHCRPGMPDRWDVAVERRWPTGPVSRRRYARQVRQDIWRAAQAVRGFVPRVVVATDPTHIHITGGGVMAAGRKGHCLPPGLHDRIADILDNPMNRRRWAAHARAKEGTCSTRS